MWFETPPKTSDWSAAIRHLRRAHPGMRSIIARVGPCTLAPRRDYFVVLIKSIYTQQISTKIATTLFGRFRDQFPMRRPTPQRVLDFLAGGADEDTIRRVGLSRQKRAYLIDLSRHFIDGRIPTRRFTRMTDDEIVTALTAVNGIGRWTAEMFLIFVLNRADIWPVDDLGLRCGEAPRKPSRAHHAEAVHRVWRNLSPVPQRRHVVLVAQLRATLIARTRTYPRTSMASALQCLALTARTEA